MPTVRLAGQVTGKRDKNRSIRARLLYLLFDGGWDIYNGNGDQEVTLGNIQDKIIESDAFIFMPGATLEDLFKATSIFVGLQTNDADLDGKSVIVMNSDNSWNPFFQLLNHLHKLGTVRENYKQFIKIVNRPGEVMSHIKDNHRTSPEKPEPKYNFIQHQRDTKINKPDFNVCVFCSASIKEKAYLEEGYNLGKSIANSGWGCISGAGRTGIMGEVVRGAHEAGGWTGGSNVPRIIEMEGLPDGLSELWSRPDIYTRMEVMIEESDAFVIMPGGTGTVQELLALIILKEQGNPIMKGKKIIIVNRPCDKGESFWKPLLSLLEKHDVSNFYAVVESVDEVAVIIRPLSKPPS